MKKQSPTTKASCYLYVESPVGLLQLRANEGKLTGVNYVASEEPITSTTSSDDSANQQVLEVTKQQLEEYFKGTRQTFNLPLAPYGTAFQQQVWQALLTVNFAETCSYQAIAEKVNNIKACQAVGAANGKNPISIIIPCHRVIGKNGELTGYAGGLSKKSYLLTLEQTQNK